MSEAVQVDEWNRTALLAVLLANPNRDTKKRPRPYGVSDFHPYAKRTKRQTRTASFFFDRLASLDGVQPSTVTESANG